MQTQKASSPKPQAYRDWLGISLSTLCGIHCIVTPFLVFLLPSVHEFFENEWIHRGLFVGVIAVVFWTMNHHYKIHRSKKVRNLFLLGMATLLISLIAHDLFHLEQVEAVLSIAGGVFIIWGHFLNLRLGHCEQGHCQAEQNCEEHI